jgi:hypothetical protein
MKSNPFIFLSSKLAKTDHEIFCLTVLTKND